MPDNDFLAVSNNPTKGVVYYLMAGLFFQLNFIFAKVLYERNPALTSFQLLFYRSLISTMIMVAVVNKDLKKTVWDSINRHNFKPLLIRVTQANISVSVNFMSVKFFTLT